MAIEATNKEDEQKVQQGFGVTPQAQAQQNQTQSVTPQLGGAQSSTLGQDVGQAQNQQQTSPGQASTGQKGSGMGARLSNLKKYIETNRGSGMAQKIQGGIEGIRSGVQQGIGQSQAKLQEQTAAEKARIARGETLIQGSQAGGGGVFEKGRSEAYTQDITPTQSQTPAPDYSQYGKTATERLAEFGKYRTGEAQQFGIENELELQRQAQELQKRADLSQSEAGRYQLLRETFNRPAYTTGQQRLDQLLLQAAPEESQTLATMAKTINIPVQEQLKQLQSTKEAENKAITEQAGALKSDIAQRLYGQVGKPTIDYTKGQITDVGTGVLSDFQKALEAQRIQAAQGIGTQYADIQGKISRGEDLTADDLAKLGRTGEDAQSFLDYYQRGQKQSIGDIVKSGGQLSDNNINQLLPIMPGLDLETFKSVQSQQPLDIGTFASNRGAVVQNGQIGTMVPKMVPTGKINYVTGEEIYRQSGTYFSPSPELQNEYNQYTSDIQSNKQALNNMISQALELNPQLATVRDAPTLDFTKYLSALQGSDIDVNKVATTEDFARQEALRQLADLQFGPLGDSKLAGTIGDVGIGKFDLQNALGQAREYYNPAQASTLGRVSSPSAPGQNLTIGQQLQGMSESVGGDLTGGLTASTTTPLSESELVLRQALAGDLTKPQNLASLPIGVTKAVGQGVVNTGLSTVAAPIGGLATVEKLITGGDTIKKTYNSVQNTAKKITRAVGSFWCSKVFELGLVNKSDLKKLQSFLSKVQFSQSPFLSWYIDNGPELVECADFLGFDWNLAKVRLFDELLPLFEKGDISGAIQCYDRFTVEICTFCGKSVPYHTRNPSFVDCLVHYPKVLLFYTKLKFKRLLWKI